MKVFYLSATSCILSLFLDSQTATDGKLVVQSRYEVSTTKLIALCWNASRADKIKKHEPTHDKIMANSQKIRSTNEILTSIRNLTPCNDEFSMYSFKVSFKCPILLLLVYFFEFQLWQFMLFFFLYLQNNDRVLIEMSRAIKEIVFGWRRSELECVF